VFGQQRHHHETMIELIDHRWLYEILRAVSVRPQRNRDLLTLGQAGTPVYPKTLSATLKHLQERSLIECEIVAHTPPVRHFSATPLGNELLAILEDLANFVDRYQDVLQCEDRALLH